MIGTLRLFRNGLPRGLDNCQWLTGKIKRNIRHPEYLLRKARKSNCDEDSASYCCIRNKVTNAIKEAKGIYKQRLIENRSNDQNAFSKTLKKILPAEEKKSVTSGINIENDICVDEKRIANACF